LLSRAVCWEPTYIVEGNYGRKCPTARPGQIPFYAGQSAGNQLACHPPVAAIVGASETTRAATEPLGGTENGPKQGEGDQERGFNEWLAGLIDGDGRLLVDRAGHASCEITMGEGDERALRLVQHRISGSVKARSVARAFRYRLHNVAGMRALVDRVNGRIRDPVRLEELGRVCARLGVEVREPGDLRRTSAWFAGLFDADGTVTFSLKGPYRNPQLTVSVTSQSAENVTPYLAAFGGGIHMENGH
jgi:hypothetical protein